MNESDPHSPGARGESGPPATYTTSSFLFDHYRPTVEYSSGLNVNGMLVQVCGYALIGLALVRVMRALDERPYGTGWLIVSDFLSFVVAGLLVNALGAFLRSFARHQRTAVVSAIMNSPHLSQKEARDLVERLD